MGEGSGNGRLLVWLSLGHLANDWAVTAIWLIAPAIAVAMDLSPAEVGLLITVSTVGAALGYLPAGMLTDRVANRGRLLLGTFWWVAIGYAVASLAPDFWTVTLLLAIAGLGDAAWHPIATGVLVQSLPGRRAQALGIHAMGGTLAEVLAPLSIGFLLSVVDWRAALLISALPAALMGIAFWRVAGSVPAAPHRGQETVRAGLGDLWRAWRGPRGLTMIAMIGVYDMALVAVLAMTPLFLQRIHAFTTAETGIAFSAMVLAGALAQPVIGRISDGRGRRPAVVGGNLAAVLACLIVATAGSPLVAVAALIAAVGALYGIRSVILAAAVEFAGTREGTTLGLTFVVMDGVGALGAVLAGAAGSIDLHYAFVLAAGFAAAAGITAAVMAFGPATRAAEATCGPAA